MPAPKWNIVAGSRFERIAGSMGVMPNTADNVKPANYAYVNVWGNDITGNGSRDFPVRSISKGQSLATSSGGAIVGPGQYYEQLNSSIPVIADVAWTAIAEGTGLSSFINGVGACLTGFVVRNYAAVSGSYSPKIKRCFMQNVGQMASVAQSNPMTMTDSVCFGTYKYDVYSIAGAGGEFNNNTFVDCNGIGIWNNAQISFKSMDNIFYRCNVAFQSASDMDYSNFYNCNFAMQTASVGPLPNFGAAGSYSGAWAYCGTMQALRDMHTAKFNTANPFANCRMVQPKFNNPAALDFTLAKDSACRNMSFTGMYIGALSWSSQVSATVAGATLINCAITDGKVTPIDPLLPFEYISPVQDNGFEAEGKIPRIIGSEAHRNGAYFDTRANLSAVTLPAGTVLTVGTPYLVENGSINYNGQMYSLNTRFTADAAIAFTTSEGAVVREILPSLPTVYMKTSRSMNSQQHFDSISWMRYRIGEKITCNRVGNIGTGAIIAGNGDDDFNPAAVHVNFFQYWQVRIVGQGANLKS